MGHRPFKNTPIGTKFGFWITTGPYDLSTKTLPCRCEHPTEDGGICGTIKSVRGVTLRNGSSTKCHGHKIAHNRKYFPGDKINNFLLYEDDPKDSKRSLTACQAGRCDSKIVSRLRDSLIKIQGCRICFPNKKRTAEAIAKQTASIRKITEIRRKESMLRIIGTRHGWITIVGVRGSKIIGKCSGNGRGHIEGEFVRQRSDVLSGKTTSCGCMHTVKLFETREKLGLVVDRTGKRFFRLVAEKKLDSYGTYLWRCDCGGSIEAFYGNVSRGDYQSCGCSTTEDRISTCIKIYGQPFPPVQTISKGQKELTDFVKSLGLTAERAWVKGIDGYRSFEIDVLVKEKKIGIEYHGERYHRYDPTDPASKNERRRSDKWYHYRKMIAAQREGIRLIQIFEQEWVQRPQIKSFLKAALGFKTRTIGAREIDFRWSSFDDIKDLLNTTHILKATPGLFYIGGFAGDELVCAAVFGIDGFTKELSLTRWVVKEEVSTPGALSKVSKMAFEKTGRKIYTKADRRFSNGAGYLAAGWEFHAQTDLDFFYYDPSTKSFIRKYRRRKAKAKTPEGMTIAEHARRDGLYKLWVPGKITFVYPAKTALGQDAPRADGLDEKSSPEES